MSITASKKDAAAEALAAEELEKKKKKKKKKAAAAAGPRINVGRPGDELRADFDDHDDEDAYYEGAGAGEEEDEEEEEEEGELSPEEELALRQRREQALAERLGVPTDSVGGLHSTWGMASLSAPLVDAFSPARVSATSQQSAETPSDAARMTLGVYKRKVDDIAREFFTSEDFEEAHTAVHELGAPFFRFELVKRAVALSLDRDDRSRELTSRLLSSLHGAHLLPIEEIAKGFERLLEAQDDLALDCPDARRHLTTFLARAVYDEILFPAFLNQPAINELGGDTVYNAKVLLTLPHAARRLEHAWGAAGAEDVSELKQAVKTTVEEYLETEDADEVVRVLPTLGGPHFGHELTKRVLVLSLERGERERELALRLLSSLVKQQALSQGQATRGFRRVREDLGDIALDVPAARSLFDRLVERATALHVIPEGVDLTPRFLSSKQADAAEGTASASSAATGGGGGGGGGVSAGATTSD